MKLIKICFVSIVLGFFNINIKAQTFNIFTEVISSGGGESLGGNYSNFGVIGETFVCKSIIGENYNATIGFLNLSDVSTSNLNNFNSSNLKIFPNPTQNAINIVSNSLIKRVEVYSILGNKILDSKYKNSINISEFSNGIYLLKIIDNYGSIILSKKIVKY